MKKEEFYSKVINEGLEYVITYYFSVEDLQSIEDDDELRDLAVKAAISSKALSCYVEGDPDFEET